MKQNLLRKIILLLLTAFLAFPAFTQSMSLEETLSNLGGDIKFRWDPFFASGAFFGEGQEISFASGREGETGPVLLGHREVLSLPLPYLDNGNIRFPHSFVDEVRFTFNRYNGDNMNRYRIGAIIIDPGHGGRDSGAIRHYVVQGKEISIIEKEIVLRASKMLHASLSAAFPDKIVLLTREGDSYPSLEERVEVANSQPLGENEIAIFISVHANSTIANPVPQGFEVFYLDPNHRRDLVDRSMHVGYEEAIPLINLLMEQEITTDSIILANFILRHMEAAVGDVSPNRGLKSHDFFVVRDTLMPAVLVELGFISNREEALRLIDNTYLMKLSDALYKGISDFIAFIERPGGIALFQ